MTLSELFTNIADAIRTKKGTSDKIIASDFATEIENLPSGGGETQEYFNETTRAYTQVSISSSSKFIVPGLLIALKKIPNIEITGTSAEKLFYGCISLITIPKLNFSNIKNFSYTFYSCESLKSIPLIDTSNGTNFSYMFTNCKKVTEIPVIDTSNGTNFSYMFQGCYMLESIPLIDTSNGTNFSYMFSAMFGSSYSSGSSKLKTIPLLNTSKGKSFNSMFVWCDALESIPLIDTSSGTNFSYMFDSCKKLTTIPQLDTSSGNIFSYMFDSCSALTDLPKLDMSNANNLPNMFYGCSALKKLGGFKNLGQNYIQKQSNYAYYGLALSYCNNLTYDSLMNVINDLYDLNLTYDVANGGTLYTQKLTLGSTNLAKLTAEEIAIATAKGWTVS